MAITINGTSGVVFNDGSSQTTAATGFGFKNRIINGAMVIDQRNATVTVNANTRTYCVDRFAGQGQNTDGVFTLAKNTSAPTGFVSSLKATVTTADASLTTNQRYFITQIIEGNNIADLAWGSAFAAPVILSFWVRSSVTGTFGGTVKNAVGTATQSYPFNFSISSADTWEQKTISIIGSTTEAWNTDTSEGVIVAWSLGASSDLMTTANAWASGNYWAATGSTNLIATLNATFYITGVQLEKNSTATSFDYRPYGTELALCQRYYETQQYNFRSYNGNAGLSTLFHSQSLAVVKRAAPTVSVTDLTYTNASSATGAALSTSAIRLGCTANATSQAGVAGTLIAEIEL